jgi:hypothetical protein
MDTGLFRERASPARYERAIALVRRMGYDFYVESAAVSRLGSGKLSVALDVINQGVAPFYRKWAVELGVLSPDGKVIRTWPTDWRLTGLLPGAPPRRCQATVDLETLGSGGAVVAVRVVNSMPHGKPLRFANADQDRHAAGWLSVGRVH